MALKRALRLCFVLFIAQSAATFLVIFTGMRLVGMREAIIFAVGTIALQALSSIVVLFAFGIKKAAKE